MKRYRVELEVVTAVHVGTGEEYNPTEYLIREGHLLRFSVERVLRRLNKVERETFLQLSDGNSLTDVLKFLHAHVQEDDVRYRLPVSSRITEQYRKNLGNPRNQLLIGEMYREMTTQRPVIPGSTLKGAIRTALVNHFAEGKRSVHNLRYPEPELLGYWDAKGDPFRAIKVTDCSIEGERTERVSGFVNYKEHRRRGNDFVSIQMFKEHLIGHLLGGDAHGNFELTIDDGLQRWRRPLEKWEPLPIQFTLADIVQSCNEFYLANFLEEYRRFYENSPYPELRENGRRVLRELNRIRPEQNQCVVRLGRFSQVENVTLNRLRRPWNKRRYGQTRTLQEELFPSGLVRLRFREVES